MDPDIIEQMIMRRIKTEIRSIRKREGIRQGKKKARLFFDLFSYGDPVVCTKYTESCYLYMGDRGVQENEKETERNIRYVGLFRKTRLGKMLNKDKYWNNMKIAAKAKEERRRIIQEFEESEISPKLKTKQCKVRCRLY